jgi:hypothetical protein
MMDPVTLDEMVRLAGTRAGLALMPLGFEPRPRGGGQAAYVLPLPGTTHEAVVLSSEDHNAPEDPEEAISLVVADERGHELTSLDYASITDMLADFREGVWDGICGSTLSLSPRSCAAAGGAGRA